MTGFTVLSLRRPTSLRKGTVSALELSLFALIKLGVDEDSELIALAGCAFKFKAIICIIHLYSNFTYGPRREKTCLKGFANNTGADQPAHPRSLISAFVIRFLKNIVSRLASSEISNF